MRNISDKRIGLEEPYASVYKYGYLKVNPQNGRRQVQLTKFDGETTTTAYARYLMAVKIGAFISSELEVDHIDNDKTNDDINNLQILTHEAHVKKTHKYLLENVVEFVDLICPTCQKPFRITKGEFNRRNNEYSSRKSKNYYCTVQCANEQFRIGQILLDQIKELDIPENTSSFIAKRLNISVHAVIDNRKNPPLVGLGIEISPEMIDRINSFEPDIYSIDDIADMLGISRNSVFKYQTVKKTKGNGRKIPNGTFERIDELGATNISNAEIARVVGVDASTVSRYLSSKRISSEGKLGMVHGQSKGDGPTQAQQAG